MDKPEKLLTDIPMPDTAAMSAEERIERLESLVHTLAQHQSALGASLIAAHTNIMDVVQNLNDAGVPDVAARNRGEPPLVVQPAQLINPGGHPLRKGTNS